jgi:hypothetical protein
MLRRFFMILILFVMSGCTALPSNSTSPSSAKPGTTTGQSAPLGEKKAGDVTVKLYGDPIRPVRGNNTLKAHLEGSNGQPITDAKIFFDIDMTNMSHGKNIVPASVLGGGDYTGKVNFMMPGPWRVIVGIEQGGQVNSARFDFTVNVR